MGNEIKGNSGVSVQKGERKLKAATSSPPALPLSKAKNGEEDRRKAGAVCIASLDAASMAPN